MSFTVMGSSGAAHTPGGSTNNAPLFDSKLTDKVRYRDALKKWAFIIRTLAITDKKYEGILQSMGVMIYMACDTHAQDLLTRAEHNGKLNLEGSIEDPKRIKLVDQILDTIAAETQFDRITREVDLMERLITCERRQGEELKDFVNRFNTAVSLYTNHIGALNAQTTRHCISLLFKNAKLPNDSFNAAITQWSEFKNKNSGDDKSLNRVIPDKLTTDLDKRVKAFKEKLNRPQDTELNSLLESIEKHVDLLGNAEVVDIEKDEEFTIEKAVNIVSRMKVDTMQSTMLASYETVNDHLKELKTRTTCRACDKPGHWWKDRKECRDKILRLRGEARTIRKEYKKSEGNFLKSKNHDKNNKTVTFNLPNDGVPDSESEHKIEGTTQVQKTSMLSSALQKYEEDKIFVNPILDGGAPHNIGGTLNILKLCDALGIHFNMEKPRHEYLHGWGQSCESPSQVIGTWYLTVHDINGNPTCFPIDVLEGSSPVMIGLETEKYSDSSNLGKSKTITFLRPSIDKSKRVFYTYFSNDNTGNERRWLELVTNPKSNICTMMANINSRHELNIAKKLHNYSHANLHEMKIILEDAGMWNIKMKIACQKIIERCDACAGSGRRGMKKKISLSHVNEAFNQEIQCDFLTVKIRGDNYEILNIVDTGTSFGNRIMVKDRSMETMKTMLEHRWIFMYGSPKKFSADPEFTRGVMEKFLETHSIHLAQRPARCSNKNGIVERQNGVFKAILEKIEKHDRNSSPNDLIARASFFTNFFHGSKTLSSFQMAMGYTPSILGLPRHYVPQCLFDAHLRSTATRALNKVLKSKDFHRISKDVLLPGTKVWVYHRSSKHTDPVEWVPARVVETEEHLVKCRRSDRGAPMLIGYEDIRVRPNDELTDELVGLSLMNEVSDKPKPIKPERQNTKEQNSGKFKKAKNKIGPSSGNGKSDLENEGNQFKNKKDTPNNITSRIPGKVRPQRKRKLPWKLALLSSSIERPDKDIGVMDNNQSDEKEVQSDRGKILDNLYDKLGSAQVSRGKIETAPAWLIDESLVKEFEDNWKPNVVNVPEKQVSRDENIVSSHVGYKVKKNEDDEKSLKARICPHGNRDKHRDEIRSDSTNAQFYVIRILLFLATILRFRIGSLDIKGAYMKSGPIKRDLYVRPPRDLVSIFASLRGIIWKLCALPYGICEAGRQWATVIEDWLLTEAGFQRVNFISQLYVKYDIDGNICMLLAKVTDDMLMAGSISEMEKLKEQMDKKFTLSKSIIDGPIIYNGCRIEQDEDGSVTISMTDYMASLSFIDLPRGRRKMFNDTATKTELKQYRTLAGSLNWLGKGVLPQASLAGSILQQSIGNLRVHHLIEANKILQEVKNMVPEIKFLQPSSDASKGTLLTFSDASFNISSKQVYGQSGVICGIQIPCDCGPDQFYALDWFSSKQKRVTHSSYGAEILAASEADDRGLHLKEVFSGLQGFHSFNHKLVVDSKSLFDTISTLHENKEYRLRQTVQRIRDSFESKQLNYIRWIQTYANISDALTKRNATMHKLLNKTFVNGLLDLPQHDHHEVDSSTWL